MIPQNNFSAYQEYKLKIKKKGMSRIKSFETRQKNRDFLKRQEDELKKLQDKCFLVNGRHKIKSQFGLKIYDKLAVLRRKNLARMPEINEQFRKGLVYRFEVFKEFSNEKPRISVTLNKRFARKRIVKVENSEHYKKKLFEAMNGGTTEKKKKENERGHLNDQQEIQESSESGDDMFGDNEKSAGYPQKMQFRMQKGTRYLQEKQEFMKEVKEDLDQEDIMKKGLKNEMEGYKEIFMKKDEIEVDEDNHYMECFPQNIETEFQESIKDGNLKKRKFSQKRMDGILLKKLKKGK